MLGAALVAATACRGERTVADPTPVHVATPPAAPVVDSGPALEHLAFGSCLKQDLPMPILADIVAAKPELFLMIGDNVYAAGPDERRLRAAYDTLAAREEFTALREAVPMYAIWDDHDYGINDGGAAHPDRALAQRLMLEFFAEPRTSARWSRDGLYDARIIGPEGRRVQIILLDTRSFRDPLVPIRPGTARYAPTPYPSATILGDAQWEWLEDRLKEPAELHIVVSSIQVIADEHYYESWSRFPHEHARIVALLAQTPGAFVISGDRHRAELSRLDTDGHPIFDLTSSSLNLPIRGQDPNRFRVGPVVDPSNFGRIDIDWEQRKIRLALVLEHGEPALEHAIDFADLGLGPGQREG
jgi:alkaline phosphatase D